MPPLGTALMVVGVGVALLAKAQRERRSAAAERARDRLPSLRPHEPLAEGLRRVIIGQLDLAIELLEEYREDAHRPTTGRAGIRGLWPGPSIGEQQESSAGPTAYRSQAAAHTVHEIRKAFKRVRALLALLREELGEKRYTRENAALRECGQRLAGARDAEVMLGTLDKLVRKHPAGLANSRAMRALHAELLAERDHAAAHAINDPIVCGEVLDELRAVHARVERWQLRERGFKLLASDLERIYARGRRQLRVARRRQSVEALHVWRKRVKELRYVAETLDRDGKPFKPVRRVARRADRLGEILGEEHDLALLRKRVRERSALFASERKARRRLLKLIARRRKQLRTRAMPAGERLYQRKPQRFVRHIKRAR